MSKDLTDALREMMGQNVANVVPAPQPRGVAPKAISAARLPGGASSSAGGVKSPWIEHAYAERTFWPTQTVNSSDGVFTLQIQPVRRVRLRDPGDAEIAIEFKAPT